MGCPAPAPIVEENQLQHLCVSPTYEASGLLSVLTTSKICLLFIHVYSIFANLGIYIFGFVFPTGPQGPTGAESNDSSDLCRSAAG